jgi:hypothetical protein
MFWMFCGFYSSDSRNALRFVLSSSLTLDLALASTPIYRLILSSSVVANFIELTDANSALITIRLDFMIEYY